MLLDRKRLWPERINIQAGGLRLRPTARGCLCPSHASDDRCNYRRTTKQTAVHVFPPVRLLLYVTFQCLRPHFRAINIARSIDSHTFRRACAGRIFRGIGNEGGYDSVTKPANADTTLPVS